jgi:AAHS family 4-hydroxybenzoate transporter-like MFS transporter
MSPHASLSTSRAHTGIGATQPRLRPGEAAATAGSVPNSIDLDELLDERKLGWQQVVILALCLLVVLLDGFDNQAIALLVVPMAQSLQIAVGSMGPVFGASATGAIVSALVIGSLADRIGRKRMLVASTLSFGLGSLITVYVNSLPELLAARFFTGIGLGGVLPNVIAIAAEFSPRRLVRTTVAVMVAGLPAGGMAGAVLATALLPKFGWHATYYIGGIAPIAVALAVAVWMPESVRYLLTRDGMQERVARIVKRIAPDVDQRGMVFVRRTAEYLPVNAQSRRASLRDIFANGRARGTLLLWAPYFMNLMVLYFSFSWLPSVILATGLSVGVSTAAIVAFNVGGVLGSVFQGPIMNKLGLHKVLAFQCGIAVLYAVVLGTMTLPAIGVVLATLVAGAVLIGIQAGLGGLAAETYPTEIRGTGSGWALGVGRLGSIAGPLIGGLMLSQHWSAQQIFLATALPNLLAMAAIYAGRRRPDTARTAT